MKHVFKPNRQEVTDLTVCRALFAAWVFFYHVDLHAQFSSHLGPAAGLLRRGYLGVDGFFILSGLILARVHTEFARSPANPWRFWGKRLARIYPVHLATILILIGLVTAGAVVGVTPRDPGRFGILSLLQNLLLIHGWGFGNQLAWNYPSWSVSMEWAGYLLFPLLCFAFFYWNTFVAVQTAIICIPILGTLAYLSGHHLNLTSGLLWLRFLPEFIAGIVTARLVHTVADVMPSTVLAWIGLVMIAGGAAGGIDIVTVLGLWLAITSFTMHADAERPAIFGKPGILRSLGLLSYSFYMSFGISEMILAQLFRHQGWDPASAKLPYAGAMILLTLMLATMLYFSVEKPCRRLADRWLDAPIGVPAPQPLAVKPIRR